MSHDLLRAGAERQKKLLLKLQREQHDRILGDARHRHDHSPQDEMKTERRFRSRATAALGPSLSRCEGKASSPPSRLPPLPEHEATHSPRSVSAMDVCVPMATSMTPIPSAVTSPPRQPGGAPSFPSPAKHLLSPVSAFDSGGGPALPSARLPASAGLSMAQRITAHEGGGRGKIERDEKNERGMVLGAWRILIAAVKRATARNHAHACLQLGVSNLWKEEIAGRARVYGAFVKARAALFRSAADRFEEALSAEESVARRVVWGLFCRSYAVSTRGQSIRLLEQRSERLRIALAHAEGVKRIADEEQAQRVDCIFEGWARAFLKVRVRLLGFAGGKGAAAATTSVSFESGDAMQSPTMVLTNQRIAEARNRSVASEHRRFTAAALSVMKCLAAQESIAWQLILRWRTQSFEQANLRRRVKRMEESHRLALLEGPKAILSSPPTAREPEGPSDTKQGDAPTTVVVSMCCISDVCEDSWAIGDELCSRNVLQRPRRRDIEAAFDEDDEEEEGPGGLVVDRHVNLAVTMDETWVARTYISWITAEFRAKRMLTSEMEQRSNAAKAEAEMAVRKIRIAVKAAVAEIAQLPEGSLAASLLCDVSVGSMVGLIVGQWDVLFPTLAGKLSAFGPGDSLNDVLTSCPSVLSPQPSRAAFDRKKSSNLRRTSLASGHGTLYTHDDENDGIEDELQFDTVGKSTPQSGVARLKTVDEEARTALLKLKCIKEKVHSAVLRATLPRRRTRDTEAEKHSNNRRDSLKETAVEELAVELNLSVDVNALRAIAALHRIELSSLVSLPLPDGGIEVRCVAGKAVNHLAVLQDVARAVRVRCRTPVADAVRRCPAEGFLVEVMMALEAEVVLLSQLWPESQALDMYGFIASAQVLDEEALGSTIPDRSSAKAIIEGSVTLTCVLFPPLLPVLDQPLPVFDCRKAATAMPLSDVITIPTMVIAPPQVTFDPLPNAIGYTTAVASLSPLTPSLSAGWRIEIDAFDGAADVDRFFVDEAALLACGLDCSTTTTAIATPRIMQQQFLQPTATPRPALAATPRHNTAGPLSATPRLPPAQYQCQILSRSTRRPCALVTINESSIVVEDCITGDGGGKLRTAQTLRDIVGCIRFQCRSALSSVGIRVFEIRMLSVILLHFFAGFSVLCPPAATQFSIRSQLVCRSPFTRTTLPGNEGLIPSLPVLLDAKCRLTNSDKSHVSDASVTILLDESELRDGDFLEIAHGPEADGSGDVDMVPLRPFPSGPATLGDVILSYEFTIDGEAVAEVLVTYVVGMATGNPSTEMVGLHTRHPSFAAASSVSLRRASSLFVAHPPTAVKGHTKAVDENGEPLPMRSTPLPSTEEGTEPSCAKQQGAMKNNSSLQDGEQLTIVASKKIVAHFAKEVPFGMLQRFIRSVTYYHYSMCFDGSTAKLTVCVDEGIPQAHTNAHGLTVRYGAESVNKGSRDVDTAEMTIYRVQSFLSPLSAHPPSSTTKGNNNSSAQAAASFAANGLREYNENSGKKLLFPKFDELREEILSVFAYGGYIRVEILHDVGASSEAGTGEQQHHHEQLSLDVSETRIRRHRYLASEIAALLPNAVASKRAETKKKKRFSLAASSNSLSSPFSPAEGDEVIPPASIFDLPTVAEAYDHVANLRRQARRSTGSNRRKSTRKSTMKSPSLSLSSAVSSFESLAQMTQSLMLSVETPQPAGMRRDTSPMPSPNSSPTRRQNLWGVVRATVSATRTVRHFGLGLRFAGKIVQQQQSIELSNFGLDESFVKPGAQLAAYKLTDASTNSMIGVLFSLPSCLVLSFAAGSGGAGVSSSTVLELIQSISYENTNRAPVQLERRVLLSVLHSSGGESYYVQRFRIVPFDDPTEIVTEWPALCHRHGATEVEPYQDAAMCRMLLEMRKGVGPGGGGPSPCLPESSHLLHEPDRACCVPRIGGLLLFSPWLSTVFDPDTETWDGGSVRVVATKNSHSAGGGYVSLLSEAAQETMRSVLMPRFHCVPSIYTLHVEERSHGVTQLFVSVSTSPSHLPGGAKRALLATITTPMVPVVVPPEVLEKSSLPDKGKGKQQAPAASASPSTSDILVLNIDFEPSFLDRWITADILTYTIQCLAFFGNDVPPGDAQIAASKPITRHFRVEVRDAENPLCGWANVSVECRPRMVAMLPHPLGLLPPSLSEGLDPALVVLYSLQENAKSVLGEALFSRAVVGVQDKEKVCGGFIEVCVLPEGGSSHGDMLMVHFGQSGISVSADGTLKGKEGALGRLYSGPGYLRIDLPGYPFEGTAVRRAAAGSKTGVSPRGNSVGCDGAVDPITPRRAAEQQLQGNSKRPGISGKRLQQLLQSIRLRVASGGSQAEGSLGSDSLISPRRVSVTVSDGRSDPCGRLEASNFTLTILVGK
jgi:hypothetical protein